MLTAESTIGTCSIWLIDKDKEILRDLKTSEMDELENELEEAPDGKTTFDMSNMLRLATIDNFQVSPFRASILFLTRFSEDGRTST